LTALDRKPRKSLTKVQPRAQKPLSILSMN